ncbi:MAG: hypothetical protein GF353_14110 [Candidatus Lokiarchaeota archaeon]|nr:hypothetical protein [Candidatus Lokiarchaeota archaeon]
MGQLKIDLIKEHLIKSWMTHDGMWFRYCLEECGIEKTNKINLLAVESMARIEIRRIKNLSNIDEIETFEDLKDFLDLVFNIVKGEFMNFSYDFTLKNSFYFIMHKCFAYEGMIRLKTLDCYQCGIYKRIESWFDELGVKYEVYPPLEECLMLKEGRCERRYNFNFK